MNQKVTVNIDLSVINKKFRHFLNDNTRVKLIYGGAGSSKSYSISQILLIQLLTQKNKKVLVTRKVGRTLRYSVFALFKKIIKDWNLTQYFSINKSDMTITYNVNGNEVMFLGLDDVEKLKSISGITDVWMEEASEDTLDDFMQLDIRLRGITAISKQIILSFNPIDQTHWIKEYFFDNPKPDTLILHSTYKDNRYLDKEYIQRLEALKDTDPYYYDVYCLGKWGSISGNKVFSNYVIEDFDISKLTNIYWGMDYGFNHASALMGVGFYENEIYFFDEYYYKHLTNTELINNITSEGFDKKTTIYSECAEPARIAEFRQKGFKINEVKKGAGSLKSGIDYLRSQRIHIHKSNCPNTAREIPNYRYRENKSGQVIGDEYVEIDDDCIAAIRYATEPIWSYKRNKVTSKEFSF